MLFIFTSDHSENTEVYSWAERKQSALTVIGQPDSLTVS